MEIDLDFLLSSEWPHSDEALEAVLDELNRELNEQNDMHTGSQKLNDNCTSEELIDFLDWQIENVTYENVDKEGEGREILVESRNEDGQLMDASQLVGNVSDASCSSPHPRLSLVHETANGKSIIIVIVSVLQYVRYILYIYKYLYIYNAYITL